VKRPKTGGRRKGTPNKATGLGKRPKTGGRRKGTPNKSTAAIRDALLQVFADLQERSGGANAHFLDWALRNPTDFYKLSAKLLPRQVSVEHVEPVFTRVELVAVGPDGIGRERESCPITRSRPDEVNRQSSPWE
jgi:hypothetical protein